MNTEPNKNVFVDQFDRLRRWMFAKRSNTVVAVIAILLICCCCAGSFSTALNGNSPSTLPTQSNNAVPNLQQTAESMAKTQVVLTQAAAIPTSIPPTATLVPTATTAPTATSTPAPIILTGSGDSIVDVPKSSDPMLLHAKYTSGSNFIVSSYDSNNNLQDVLINTIGSYEGTVPLDFLNGEFTTRLEVKASGPWEIQILPLSQVKHAAVPGTIQGVGDDVIYLDGSNLDIITADASTAQHNFIVFSYSKSGYDIVFNEIAPYTGSALISPTTFMISVKATGPWSVTITTK